MSFAALVTLQLFSRLLTFVLNTLIARSLGPSWYAFANVQLQLVSATVLFMAKEATRRAAQRIYPGGGGAAHAARTRRDPSGPTRRASRRRPDWRRAPGGRGTHSSTATRC